MAVSVDPKTKKLIIRFRVKGYPKQFYLSTGLTDNKSNRAIVESRWELIQREISLGEFDPTLERYKFGVKKSKLKIQNSELTISELWDKFTKFKTAILEAGTICNYERMGRAIAKSPNQALTDAPAMREFLLKNYTYGSARSTLNHLSLCCDWAVNSNLITENPFKPLLLPKPKKSSDEDVAAYTLEERDLIIQAFEHHPKFNYYANLIKFLFWTGCRPGEAIALTWGDVSSDCTRISISKAFASRANVTKGTKNGKKRIFPTGNGSRLQNLLLEMRSPQARDDELIFKTPWGKQLTLAHLSRAWRGMQTREYFYPGVVKELAAKGKIPFLKFYSTRHTFATWAIASGASPDKVAYWLGDDVQTVLMYYCHPDVSKSECPDF